MDKRSLLAIVLITGLVMAWMMYTSVQQRPVSTAKKQADSALSLDKKSGQRDTVAAAPTKDSARAVNAYGQKFATASGGTERVITVENSLVRAKISSRGGAVIYWELKNFKKWDGEKAQLINSPLGESYMTFTTLEGKRIDSRNLYFSFAPGTDDSYKISGDSSLTLTLTLEVAPGKSIVRRMKFFGNKYDFENTIVLNNLEDVLPSRGYSFSWENGLKYMEENSVDESSDAHAVISMNGEAEELNADKDDPVESSGTGIIDYTGVKTKYFAATIIPQPYKSFDGTADLSGRRAHFKNSGVVEYYKMAVRVPYKGGLQSNTFKVFIGPLDYNIAKSYGIEKLINFGFKYGIRQIAEFFMLPIFKGIHHFVPNFGISIILFSILMKLLLYPLSISQMKTSQKMQLLTPEMNKMRERYKDDPTKQQQETMKLYSEYGINPAGGCLPLLLQMPILFALWNVLRTSIDLRHSEFIWWIKDLSVPDKVFDFGFSFLGISHLSGLALLMGITMFVQQKMTITDPRQKTMVYMMPVMFTLMFANFPAGLNLYYFVFNLLSIGQQYYMNHFSRSKVSLEEMRKAPKKESWLQKKMREAQQIAESQGRPMPGQRSGQRTDSHVQQDRPRQQTRRKPPTKK